MNTPQHTVHPNQIHSASEAPLRTLGLVGAALAAFAAYDTLTTPTPAGILKKMSAQEKFNILNHEGQIEGIKQFIEIPPEQLVALADVAATIAKSTQPHVVVKGEVYEDLVRERLRAARLVGQNHSILTGKAAENYAMDIYADLIYRLSGTHVNRPLQEGETIGLPTKGAARLFAMAAVHRRSIAAGLLGWLHEAQTDVKGRLCEAYIPGRKRY